MSCILHLNFIGAKTFREKKMRRLECDAATVVLGDDFVIDCDEKAWGAGVRRGDTLGQVRLSSSGCQIIRIRGAKDAGSREFKEILDALSGMSPYVEPSVDGWGVFVDASSGVSVPEIISSLESLKGNDPLFFRLFIGQARSKLVAKMSSDYLSREYTKGRRMPTGATTWGRMERGESFFRAQVDEGKEKAFLSGINLEHLWLLPPEILSTFRALGLKKIKDVRDASFADLARHVGDWAYPVKAWANGEDRSVVKALYPPPCLVKEINFDSPEPLREELFDGAVADLSEELGEKGLGFKSMTVSFYGDFPPYTGEKRFVRPIASKKAMKVALKTILDGFSKKEDFAISRPSISGFVFKLDEIVAVQATPVRLIGRDTRGLGRATPLALDMTIEGLERKFGSDAVQLGRYNKRDLGIRPEIVRREKMMAHWDPMSAGFGEG